MEIGKYWVAIEKQGNGYLKMRNIYWKTRGDAQGSRGWRLKNKWMEFKVQGDLAIMK